MKKSLYSLNHSGYESFDTKAANHLYVFDAEAVVDLGIANDLYRIVQKMLKSSKWLVFVWLLLCVCQLYNEDPRLHCCIRVVNAPRICEDLT